jgi:predicted Fe-S protein YdhL (DUF1289 family)
MQGKEITEVASPCVDNCCLGDDDICMGCFRSLQEILLWGGADPQLRLEILRQVEERKRAEKA